MTAYDRQRKTLLTTFFKVLQCTFTRVAFHPAQFVGNPQNVIYTHTLNSDSNLAIFFLTSVCFMVVNFLFSPNSYRPQKILILP